MLDEPRPGRDLLPPTPLVIEDEVLALATPPAVRWELANEPEFLALRSAVAAAVGGRAGAELRAQVLDLLEERFAAVTGDTREAARFTFHPEAGAPEGPPDPLELLAPHEPA